jgi:hypothetical protein
MARKVTATSTISGLDHETFGANETATKTSTGAVTLDTEYQTQNLIKTELRLGRRVPDRIVDDRPA